MKPDLMNQLTRSQREAVESAGYRVMRWVAARGVLQSRVTKRRIPGSLGDFLAHWLPLAPAHEPGGNLSLSFDHALKINGGSTLLATSPLERALLHLPALRSFWRQELRQQHFAALLSLVPQAWLLDPADVPPGAVIHGLGVISWEQEGRLPREGLEIRDVKGHLRNNQHTILAARDSILISPPSSGVVLNARYARNEKDQVVLRSLEASP